MRNKILRVNPPQDLLLSGIITSGIALLSILPLDTARPATAEGRLQTEVDVLLRVEANDEGWNVNHLAITSMFFTFDLLNNTEQ